MNSQNRFPISYGIGTTNSNAEAEDFNFGWDSAAIAFVNDDGSDQWLRGNSITIDGVSYPSPFEAFSRNGIPFGVGIVGNLIGKAGRLTAEEIADMAGMGMEPYNHTWSHGQDFAGRDLADTSWPTIAEYRKELVAAKTLVESLKTRGTYAYVSFWKQSVTDEITIYGFTNDTQTTNWLRIYADSDVVCVGMRIKFTTDIGTSGLQLNTVYWVVDVRRDPYGTVWVQIATTRGGNPIDIAPYAPLEEQFDYDTGESIGFAPVPAAMAAIPVVAVANRTQLNSDRNDKRQMDRTDLAIDLGKNHTISVQRMTADGSGWETIADESSLTIETRMLPGDYFYMVDQDTGLELQPSANIWITPALGDAGKQITLIYKDTPRPLPVRGWNWSGDARSVFEPNTALTDGYELSRGIVGDNDSGMAWDTLQAKIVKSNHQWALWDHDQMLSGNRYPAGYIQMTSSWFDSIDSVGKTLGAIASGKIRAIIQWDWVADSCQRLGWILTEALRLQRLGKLRIVTPSLCVLGRPSTAQANVIPYGVLSNIAAFADIGAKSDYTYIYGISLDRQSSSGQQEAMALHTHYDGSHTNLWQYVNGTGIRSTTKYASGSYADRTPTISYAKAVRSGRWYTIDLVASQSSGPAVSLCASITFGQSAVGFSTPLAISGSPVLPARKFLSTPELTNTAKLYRLTFFVPEGETCARIELTNTRPAAGTTDVVVTWASIDIRET